MCKYLLKKKQTSQATPVYSNLIDTNHGIDYKPHHLTFEFINYFLHFLRRVVVVLAVKTYVYNFADLTLIDCLDTCNNPNGLCALNSENSCMLAIPHTEKGHVKVRSFAEPNRTEAVIMCH